ncbi:U32 family peptidase [bacterium]|nr:U32 family peptidase [bacterium]
MSKIELLAPAKNLECGISAVNCGADAVYIGAERFSARQDAGNDIRDIESLIRHGRKYRAAVYAAVNTILRDDELPEALALIRRLYEAGISGLIIQDFGLLESGLPPLPLIASTQMHNDSAEKVAFLEAVGFSRVILARELGLAELRSIREKTSIELEVFVHGSLCVSFSGCCLMSYAIGGRSANRGQCAQPCRRLYKLTDDRGADLGRRHWLSLKDMNRSRRLKDLLDAGVTSFKIEGRLKDREAVANATRYFRRELDAILEGSPHRRSSSGTVIGGFDPDLNKTFNRGFTDFFLDGRSRGIAGVETPKYLGECIGEVVSIAPDRFFLKPGHGLNPGDGIAFFLPSGDLKGSVVNLVSGNRITPDRMDGIVPGVRIHRNRDHRFIQSVLKDEPERKIRVRMILESKNGRLCLKVDDEDGNRVALALEADPAPARNPESAESTIRKQLTSLGGTDFICESLDISVHPMPFAPVSEWNRLRREALLRLDGVRSAFRPPVVPAPEPNHFPYPSKRLTFAANVLNAKAEAFYRRHGVEIIEPAAESGLDMRGRKVITTRYCLRAEIGRCPGKQPTGHSAPAWILEDGDGRRFPVRFNCDDCIMEVFFGE